MHRPISRAPPFARLLGRSLSAKASYHFLEVSEEVREAVHSGKPVVALETTIYTHGFPYPDNIALSSRLESIVRERGAVPATIGILNGVARIGLQPEDLIQLLDGSSANELIKVSRRDIGWACGLGVSGTKVNGGTTIAGTLVLSHLAGIKVFATGGLGGVHKGGEDTLDISADLTELGRTPVALVSSGCKSFLDIPRTLEFLETQGVGVSTFVDGREGPIDFPMFWTRNSGTRSPAIVEDEKEAAGVLHAQLSLALTSGLLFASPIDEQYSLPKDEMDRVMAQAVADAGRKGIVGRDNTPFVLDRIRAITDGATVTANTKLVEKNVERGAKLALELARLELHDKPILKSNSFTSAISVTGPRKNKRSEVLVAGSLALDVSCDYAPLDIDSLATAPSPETSNPARITQSIGGVGSNIATALNYLGVDVELCSVVGQDPAGETLMKSLRERGMDTGKISVATDGHRTAQYVAFNDMNKDLVMSMADMSIIEVYGSSSLFRHQWIDHLKKNQPQWVVVDANWTSETISMLIRTAKQAGCKVAFEPMSVEKAQRLQVGTRGNRHVVDIATPNRQELSAMHQSLCGHSASWLEPEVWQLAKRMTVADISDGLLTQALELLRHIPTVLTKCGRHGVLLTRLIKVEEAKLGVMEKVDGKGLIETSQDWQSDGMVLPLSPKQGIEIHDTHPLALYARLIPPPQTISRGEIISVNGVGDTLLGALVAGLVRSPELAIDDLIISAQEAAAITLKSPEAVGPGLKTLREHRHFAQPSI